MSDDQEQPETTPSTWKKAADGFSLDVGTLTNSDVSARVRFIDTNVGLGLGDHITVGTGGLSASWAADRSNDPSDPLDGDTHVRAAIGINLEGKPYAAAGFSDTQFTADETGTRNGSVIVDAQAYAEKNQSMLTGSVTKHRWNQSGLFNPEELRADVSVQRGSWQARGTVTSNIDAGYDLRAVFSGSVGTGGQSVSAAIEKEFTVKGVGVGVSVGYQHGNSNGVTQTPGGIPSMGQFPKGEGVFVGIRIR